jgi:y4mF family transcriptional regulator
VPSDKYLLPNNPAARSLREARARFDALEPGVTERAIGEAIRDLPITRLVQAFRGVASSKSTTTAVGQAHINASALTPITSAADLAPLIRASRKRMKMSQQQFADACGVGRRFLSELENGKPSLEFDKVLKCALGAGIDLLAKPRRPL